ncbi:frataxin family protein [Ferruginibacter sp.]
MRFLGESLLAGYLIILIIKIIAFCKLKKYCGDYTHESSQNNNLKQVKFHISLENVFLYFINPIQSIRLQIERKGDEGDWTSNLQSDILNLHHFQGLYLIKNKPDGGQDGWLDAYLFNRPYMKIALHLHYLENNRWKEDEGYYIIKSD